MELVNCHRYTVHIEITRFKHPKLSRVVSEDASKKIGKLSKEIGAREAQLRSEAMVTEEYERRIWEMEALVNDAKEREEQIHAG